MNDSSKTYLFETMPIPKTVMTLSVPTVISSLVMVIYNMSDTYFVGMLNDPIQNAAVTLAAPVLLSFNAITNLFGVGASSVMSRGLGRKDDDTVARSSAFGFYGSLLCGLLVSILFTAFQTPLLSVLGADGENIALTRDYLWWTTTLGAVPAILNVIMANLVRAEGSTLHASIGTMSGCVLNIILDPVFILPRGLGMGAAGAGLATFLSNCAACVYFFCLLYVRREKTSVCIRPSMFRPNKDIVGGILAVGIPAAIQNLLNVTGMTVLNNFTSSYGDTAVAAMGIVQKINMIPVYMAMGLAQGIMPLVSYNFASGNSERTKQAISFAAKIALSFMVLVSFGFYVGAGWLTSLFMDNEVIVAYGTRFLRGLCLSLPFACMDFLAVGVFQACGFGKKALVFALLRKIGLEIPALIILDAMFPLYGLAYAQFAAEVVMSIAATIVLLRLFRKLDNAPKQMDNFSKSYRKPLN